MKRGIKARLAQSVERQALNLVVGGSSPPVGDFLFLNLFVVCNSANVMQEARGVIANDCGESIVQPENYSSVSNRELGCTFLMTRFYEWV